MSLVNKLLSASGGGVDKLYVDSVFSAYTYTGAGANQTINNGIDLLGKGGLVWIKKRSAANSHYLIDTIRGGNKILISDSTSPQSVEASNYVTAQSTGYQTGVSDSGSNASPGEYVSWTFRKAPKFFDIVTYTGNGVAGRQIPHELSIAPGMIICKATSTTSNWPVYHRSLSANNALTLNSTSAAAASSAFGAPTDSVFTAGNNPNYINENGVQYVAYLFAHDDSEDGIVQCGSFTTDGSGNATVNLGWEPKFLMFKTANAVGDWGIVDISRGLNSSSASSDLRANQNYSENTNNYALINATGFTAGPVHGASKTVIYIAIRRSNKPPTLGTQVYNAIARTGTGAAATVTGVGFAPDLVMSCPTSNVRNGYTLIDKMRGAQRYIFAASQASETLGTNTLTSFDMDGVTIGSNAGDATTNNQNALAFINHFFKRAVGVFDEVCYTGTGSARTVQHGLGVVPELMIVKQRSASGENWQVFNATMGATKFIWLNTNNASQTGTVWNNTLPTTSVFSITGSGAGVNDSLVTHVCYLFASKAGISKVFSYTGNGSSQTIDCGFTTGARFVMVKRTDAAGDWMVSDVTRGIVASSDPRLSLNTTAAEITTDDWLDPDGTGSGFIVNQTAASNANVSGATYIGLSFA
jgi:hypothetical protein